tara:strand:- start:231 stop:413 length:183 start_codon:yes stop_codon:yes gene_type:complete
LRNPQILKRFAEPFAAHARTFNFDLVKFMKSRGGSLFHQIPAGYKECVTTPELPDETTIT